MVSIWEANEDIKAKLRKLKTEHHPHLSLAGIWLLCNDGQAIRDNQVVTTRVSKCTKTEKLASGYDFKIEIMMETWAHLTDKGRLMALDHALCQCGVRHVPQKMEINGRKEIVKDELGRIMFTDEVEYDKQNNPKWKINKPDAPLFFEMISRYGMDYCEEADNVQRLIANKPLKGPAAPLFEEKFHVGIKFETSDGDEVKTDLDTLKKVANTA